MKPGGESDNLISLKSVKCLASVIKWQ